MPRKNLKNKYPEIAKTATRLRGEGLSYREIAEKLTAETGFVFNHMSVKRMIMRTGNPLHYLLGAKNAAKKEQEDFLDTVKQLKRINKKAWKVLNILEQTRDYNVLIKYIKEIRDQLEFENKLIGRISEGQTNVTQNIDIKNITLNIDKVLLYLQKHKYIKILKMPEAAII